MEARQWVMEAIEALRLEWSILPPERQRALAGELSALLSALERCVLPVQWVQLQREVQAFATRSGLRALPRVDQSGSTMRGHDHGLRTLDPSTVRGWSPTELAARFRRLLVPERPRPIETYPEVDAPDEVTERTQFRVDVTARSRPTARAGAKIALARDASGPVDLEVEVELPPDGSVTAACQLVQPLRVPDGSDSATLGFALMAERPGPAQLTVRFRQDGVERLRADHTVVVRAIADAAARSERSRAGGTLRTSVEHFAGLVLRVEDRGRDAAHRHIRATLTGPRALLPGTVEGTQELPANASTMIVQLCREFAHAVKLADLAARAQRIENIGAELARSLLPATVAAALAAVPEATALHIEAEDAWAPWEMAWLERAGFLGERFAVTRWLRRGSAWDRLPGGRAVLVAPVNPTLQPADERTALRALAGSAPIELRTAHETMKELTSPQAIGFLHFTCHGAAEPDAALGGRLGVEDGELRPIDVRPAEALAGALVFINACQIGIETRMLSGHGGWAEAFLSRGGAGAFIAPSWSINDRAAGGIARELYRWLGQGETIGEAARKARIWARDHLGHADPDRLAYAVYASPTARLDRASSGQGSSAE